MQIGLTKRDHKEEDGNNLPTHRTPVGKLITHNLLRNIPAQEETGDDGCQRRQQLRREVITIGKEILAKKPNPELLPEKENRNTAMMLQVMVSIHAPLERVILRSSLNHRRTNLVHGDGRGECRQYQQGIRTIPR